MSIERPPAQVYAFAIKQENLARWASGLANFSGKLRFAEENTFGVLDHDVVLDSGTTFHNPMRVVANEAGSEVVFTVLRQPDTSDEQLAADADTVQRDLLTLKRLVEEEPLRAEAAAAAHAHHAIDYVELEVSDLEAAIAFYEAAFEWRFNRYGASYAGIQGSGREMGGLSAGGGVAGGSPLVILYSRDLDATLAAVRNAGGRIVREPYGFPGGRRFHFADPSGNELAVWSHPAP